MMYSLQLSPFINHQSVCLSRYVCLSVCLACMNVLQPHSTGSQVYQVSKQHSIWDPLNNIKNEYNYDVFHSGNYGKVSVHVEGFVGAAGMYTT